MKNALANEFRIMDHYMNLSFDFMLKIAKWIIIVGLCFAGMAYMTLLIWQYAISMMN